MLVKRTLHLPEASGGAAAIDNTGAMVATEVTGNRMRLHHIDSNTEIRTIPAADTDIYSIALHALTELLAVGETDGHVALRNLRDGEVHNVITVRDRIIDKLSFSPDGRLLAVGDDNGLITVFLVSSGQELWRVETEQQTNAIAVSNLGSPVLTGDDRGIIHVYHRAHRTRAPAKWAAE